MPLYEARDPIHRAIHFDEAERQVVDHPWVQRLRSVKQLGFVSLVYPGAVHDRFQHSLGVMYLAGHCFDRLCQESPLMQAEFNPADRAYCRRVVRLAGLLHDVGHAPLSHTSETFFPSIESMLLPEEWYRTGYKPKERQATHEDLSVLAVYLLSCQGIIPTELAQDVAAVLCDSVRRGPKLRSFGAMARMLRALVSGEMDADRCDYLLRDSHFTGVSYGVYDLDRLIACQMVLPGPDGPELGLDVHGVHALEGLLMARYHMFLQVYFHKTPPAFEYYLEQAVRAGEISLNLESSPELILSLRDEEILSRLHAAAAQGAPWSRRILHREPAKLLLRERVGDDTPENFIAQELIRRLQEAGCHVFTRRSKQVFTSLAGAGSQVEGSRLMCERRILGRPRIEPVAAHSHLLKAFNRPIDLRHTYVLRDDAAKASKVIGDFPPI